MEIVLFDKVTNVFGTYYFENKEHMIHIVSKICWYCLGSHTYPIINPTSLGPVYPLDTSFSQVYKECIRGQEPLLDIHRKKGVGTVFKFFSSSWILTHLYIFHLTPKSKLSILTKVEPQNFVRHWRIGWTSQIPPSMLISALESQRGTRPKKVKLHWERGRAQ